MHLRFAYGRELFLHCRTNICLVRNGCNCARNFGFALLPPTTAETSALCSTKCVRQSTRIICVFPVVPLMANAKLDAPCSMAPIVAALALFGNMCASENCVCSLLREMASFVDEIYLSVVEPIFPIRNERTCACNLGLALLSDRI